MSFDEQQYRKAAVLTAAYLCRHGIKIFVAEYGSKKPVGYWTENATNDINEFVKKVPAGPFNVAMTFGPTSGICDVEPDTDEGTAVIEGLMAEANCRTLAYKSRRGVHRIFQWTDRLAPLNKNNPKAKGLECRLASSDKDFYSICPPSLHPDTGEHYEWLPGCAPWEVGPAPMPEVIIQWFLANVRPKGQDAKEVEVGLEEDGYLPQVGNRHEFLLAWSKSLYCDWQLPTEDCVELSRYMAQRVGTYSDPDRGETEVKNLFNNLRRPVNHGRELIAAVDMQVVAEAAHEAVGKLQYVAATGDCPEIPSHIFPPLIEEASQQAKLAGYPRNLWLMTILTTAMFQMGQSVRVRASVNHDTLGGQLYTFGVGGSGSGKSKTMKVLLGPTSHSDAMATDSSPEALVSLLAKYPRGVLLQFTEGKDFFKMFNKYNTTGQSDNSLYHKCFSGDTVVRVLQKGRTVVRNPHLVVSAAIQQVNLNQMPMNDCLDGLLQRMFIYPIGEVPRRESEEALAAHNEFLKTWYEICQRLGEIKPTIGSPSLSQLISATGQVELPLTLTLDDQARHLWKGYAETKKSPIVMAQWPEDHPHRADVVRHAEIALKFAQGLNMLWCACDPAFWMANSIPTQQHGWIPPHILQGSIDLMEWGWLKKQKYVDHIVEAAFASVSGDMLKREESVTKKMDDYLKERRRRVERVTEEWTLRDYYTILRLKKVEARQEVDLFLREGHIVQLPPSETQKVERYKFLGEVE
jgi:hypothetical protein